MHAWLSLVTLAALSATPVLDETQESAEAIRALGGTVLPVSQKDDLVEVDFHLEGRAVGDDALAHVAALGKVARLNLANTQVTDAGLAHLAGLQDLSHLYLQNTTLEGDGLQHLAGLPKLVYLNLYGTKVGDAGLRHLEGCRSLQQVYLWQTAVSTDGALALLTALPELHIDLGADAGPLRVPQVYTEEKTAEALRHVQSIGGSIHKVSQDSDEVEVDFHIGSRAVSDADLAVLVEIPGLVGLHLGGTRITDAGLRHVGELKDLRRLHLEHTPVTAAGVATLTALPELEYLNLFQTPVDDAVLESLGKMRRLRKVFLWQTGVTEAGAAALRSTRSDLHVDTGWVATLAVAEAEPVKEDATCCERAGAAAKACEHPCCVAAAKNGRTCFKCNPKLAKTCCEKAEAEAKECAHPCCVAARAEGKLCEKCNPAK